ncbi:hypothetical protein MKMG_02184 [Methanogenium sp. MK-MG]|nr:hypothetical protein MKMG_02184 [Methanogenium sp. MK-MG]
MVSKYGCFVRYFKYCLVIVEYYGGAIGCFFERMYGVSPSEKGSLRPSVWMRFLGVRACGGGYLSVA